MIGDALPVNTSADVMAVLPAFIRASDTAPVRDAIVALLTAIFAEMQNRAEYAAAQSDILYATGIYLYGQGEDRGFIKQSTETDEAFRARALGIPLLVTPNAIMTMIASLIAPYTSKHAKYFEASVDRWFVSNGSAPWHSFVGASPSYLDRLYKDDVLVNGTHIPHRNAGGAWLFNDTIGRYFVIRVPDLTGADTQHAYLLTGAGVFLANGANVAGGEAAGTNATFLFNNRQTALDTYAAIIGAVNRVKATSMRWMLYVDPLITT